MKVSREQAAKNRAHVVDVAGRQFREHGFDGIGIADLMQAAGLTHGGFYANFASKDELAAEAVSHAIAESTALMSGVAAGAENQLAAVVDYYLSERHRDGRDTGCVLAALAPDAARRGDGLRQTFENGVENYLAGLEPLMAGASTSERRREAMATLSTMLGALVLSRAVASPEFSKELLDAGAASLLEKSSS